MKVLLVSNERTLGAASGIDEDEEEEVGERPKRRSWRRRLPERYYSSPAINRSTPTVLQDYGVSPATGPAFNMRTRS